MMENNVTWHLGLETPSLKSADGQRSIQRCVMLDRPRDVDTRQIWHPSKQNRRDRNTTGDEKVILMVRTDPVSVEMMCNED